MVHTRTRLLVCTALYMGLCTVSLAHSASPDAAELTKQGDDLRRAKDYAGAVEVYQKALKLTPDDADLQLRLAVAAHGAGLKKVGLDALDAYERLRPNETGKSRLQDMRRDLKALVDKATVSEAGDRKDAVRALVMASMKAVISDAMADKDDFEKLGRVAEARKRLQEFVADPEQGDVQVWRLAGAVAVLQGDPLLAAYAVEGILRLDPGAATEESGQRSLVQLYEVAGEEQLREAAKVRSRVLQLLRDANGGDAKAACELGNIFDEHPVYRCEERAIQWYETAVKAGHVPAMREYGVKLCYPGRPADRIQFLGGERAITLLRQAADAGDVEAEGVLGRFGKGRSTLEAAAEKKRPWALNALAGKYEFGSKDPPVPKDEGKAYSLYREAAELGCVDAIFSMHMIDHDDSKYVALLSRAARGGDVHAARLLVSVCSKEKSLDDAAPKNAREAATWGRWLINRGDSNPFAFEYLAVLLIEGHLGSQDFRGAEKLGRNLIARGYAQMGLYVLARVAFEGDGTVKNETWGLKQIQLILQDRSEEGIIRHRHSLGDLGRRLLTGNGIPADPAKGIRLLTFLAEAGSVNAMAELSSAYSVGRGVPRDRAKADYWNDRAQRSFSGSKSRW